MGNSHVSRICSDLIDDGEVIGLQGEGITRVFAMNNGPRLSTVLSGAQGYDYITITQNDNPVLHEAMRG